MFGFCKVIRKEKNVKENEFMGLFGSCLLNILLRTVLKTQKTQFFCFLKFFFCSLNLVFLCSQCFFKTKKIGTKHVFYIFLVF